MEAFNRGRHRIDDVEKVICPYCRKQYVELNGAHLKVHGKTLSDMRREFPDSPTITFKLFKKKVDLIKEQIENHQVRKMHCMYKNDPDCPGGLRIVPFSYRVYVCPSCRAKGKKFPWEIIKFGKSRGKEKISYKKTGKEIDLFH